MEFYQRFIKDRDILSVGDGNLSFTKKIVQIQALCKDTNLIATSIYHNTPDKRKKKYLDRMSIPIYLSVDAVRLPADLTASYDTIIWSYPYPVIDDPRTPVQLIREFLTSIAEIAPSAIIILGLKALKEEPHHQFDMWGLGDMLETLPTSYIVMESYTCKVFWEATHVTGKLLHKSKTHNLITYYALKVDALK